MTASALAQLSKQIREFSNSLALVTIYGAADQVRDRWRRLELELAAVLAALGEPPASPEQAIYVRCVEPWHIWPDDHDTRCQCGQSTRRLVGDAPPAPAGAHRMTTVQLISTHETIMTGCVCGDVFFESGTPAHVGPLYDIWKAQHATCVKQPSADNDAVDPQAVPVHQFVAREPFADYWMLVCAQCGRSRNDRVHHG